MGNINSNYNCESEIGTFKFKMERFADNVTNKLEDLESEIHNIKENKLYSIVVLENVIDELKKEKLDLCKTNADLRKKNISMKNTIADLSLTNKNLKNEKSSLLAALQLIQTDYNQLTVNAKALGIEKSCQVVNEHKTLHETKKSPRNTNAFTYNPNEMTREYSDKGDISMSNRYEVLSDSDDNIDNESTNKLNRRNHMPVQQHQKVQMTVTLLRSTQQTFHLARPD